MYFQGEVDASLFRVAGHESKTFSCNLCPASCLSLRKFNSWEDWSGRAEYVACG